MVRKISVTVTMLFAIILLFLVIICPGGFSTPVLHGEDAGSVYVGPDNLYHVENPGDFPYVVYMKTTYIERSDGSPENKFSFRCGGIILNEKVILTVAHCIYKPKGQISKIEVQAGIIHLQYETNIAQKRKVLGYKIHEDFYDYRKRWLGKDDFNINDLAILWLEEPLQMTNLVQKAKLPITKFNINSIPYGTCVGWGREECGYQADMMQKVQLKTISLSKCQKKYGTRVSANTFCAKSYDSKSIASSGDSGGPFIFNGIVVGLLSYGTVVIQKRYTDNKEVPQCDPYKPVAFTDLYKYDKWIKDSMTTLPAIKCKSASDKYCLLHP